MASDADAGFADGADMDWVTGVEGDEYVASTELGFTLWLTGAGEEVVVVKFSKMSFCAPSGKLYAAL